MLYFSTLLGAIMSNKEAGPGGIRIPEDPPYWTKGEIDPSSAQNSGTAVAWT